MVNQRIRDHYDQALIAAQKQYGSRCTNLHVAQALADLVIQDVIDKLVFDDMNREEYEYRLNLATELENLYANP